MDIEKILCELTVEEKAGLCAGSDTWHTYPIERLGIPSVMVADGPHGLRKVLVEGDGEILRDSYPATCFPTASALASTWNVDLVKQVGNAIGDECLAERVSVILGPGVNIKRSPLCGRNFEYFSEDPFLTGEIATAFIKGVQEKGVGTSLKHYAVNNQEYRRMLIDVVVDERALREIYLAGFETAVKRAKPWTVMASYNKVNGTYCTENEKLLDAILREEWGFNGIVISDWGAVNERVDGVAAGLDLEMPGVLNGNEALIVEAVRSGILDENILDGVVRRMLALIDKSVSSIQEEYICDLNVNHQLARETASEGAVLLKNEGNLLPLEKDTNVALIGQFAKNPRYQGSGSSLIHPSRMDTLYETMVAYAGIENIDFADGYSLAGDANEDALIAEAVYVANKADVAVVCARLTDMDEMESMDRGHMRLPIEHDKLIAAVVEANPNTIVLLSNGSPVEMSWIREVPAVLEGYLGGQAGAGAHCAILYGEVNPSGKLAETFPIALEDNPSYPQFPGGPCTVEYRESIYVGYRFYDSVGKEVLFPFGHGLSYTTFAYSDLKISKKQIKAGDELKISFKVKNIGSMAGKEIAQLYIKDTQSIVFRPEKELKGFVQVSLKPGEDEVVSISLNKRAFAYYDVEKADWTVEPGEFEILVGGSSRNIHLSETVQLKREEQEQPSTSSVWYGDFPENAEVPLNKFEELLGKRVPENPADSRPYTLNTPILDMRRSLIGRILEKIIRKQIDSLVPADMHGPTRMMFEQMALESPLHVLITFSSGALNKSTLEGLLHLANGKIWLGVSQLIRANRSRT